MPLDGLDMLTITCEHALRALAELAALPKDASLLGRRLARQADVPANYLSKLLLTLRNAGLVDTTRGSGGGYRLSRNPDQIRLLEVVRLFDGPRADPDCLLGHKHPCSDQNACSAHEAWKKVRAAYLQFLEQTTLADITLKKAPSSEAPKHAPAVGQSPLSRRKKQ